MLILAVECAALLRQDNDGDIDMFLGHYGGGGRGCAHGEMLYRNNGDGTFTDITTTDFGTSPSEVGGGEQNTNGATFGDFDGDSNLDLVKSTSVGAMMYVGNGDGTFETGVLISDNAHRGQSVKGDFNGDGWPVEILILQNTFVRLGAAHFTATGLTLILAECSAMLRQDGYLLHQKRRFGQRALHERRNRGIC